MSNEDRAHREHAIKRRVGLDPIDTERLTNEFLSAEDLHWTCPECKTKITGTMADLEKGCLKCLIQ